MKYYLSFLITGTALLLGLSDASSQHPEIPRDSSYNPKRVLNQARRNYPTANLASTDPPGGVTAHHDIIYVTIPNTPYGDRSLRADIFRPAKEGKYPAVIMIHGGGWSSGDKSMQRALAVRLAARGFVTICPEYQLSPEALYPAALHNIKALIRWARAHADQYAIDPGKMAASGCSAGGQLALLAGLTSGVTTKEGSLGVPEYSSEIQAIMDIDGLADFLSPLYLESNRMGTNGKVENNWLHGSYYEHAEIWKDASPLFWAHEYSPPMLFVKSGFPRFTAGLGELTGLLDTWGIYYEVHQFDIQVHPFWLLDPWVDPTVDCMADFLNKVFE